MAMYEQQSIVNVEFLKSSRGFLKGRVIKLSHGHQLPPQLIGRVDPVGSLVLGATLLQAGLHCKLRLTS